MRISLKLLSIILLILALIFLFTAASEGAQQPNPQWTLLDKIEECKNVLKDSPGLEFAESKGQLIRKQVSLCILDIETGDVFEKRYWLNESEIARADYLRKNYLPNPDGLPRFMPVDMQEELTVVVNWWNTFNSDLSIVTVDDPETDIYVVAAVKYLFPNTMIHYSADRTGKKYSSIVYGPYSEEVHDSDIVKRGGEFMKAQVKQAFQRLRDARVMSRSYPGKLVADTIREELVLNLMVTEQTDPQKIISAQTEEERRKPAERVLVRYGINEEETFRYTYSSTKALGPAQIMPATYRSMVREYPAANLIGDVNIGRVDIVNSLMAAVLVLDDHFLTVKNRVYTYNSRRQQYASPQAIKIFEGKNEDKLDEIRMMSYNGGPGKYKLSTGDVNPRARGAKETTDFIRKFRIIKSLRLFEQI